MKEDSFCVRASTIYALEAVASSSSVHAHQASFQLFRLLLNRYGTGITGASDMALTWLSHYADGGGYDGIGHLVGRIFDALGVQLDEEIPFQALLRQGALKGSHTAFEDLKKHYPDAYDETLALFRERGGAMGMSQRSELFPWVDVRSLEGIANAIENSPSVELRDIYVTEDEDTLLHCAARSGYLGVVKGLINLGMSVNVINRLGETPLLEASRAGHYEVSNCLIEMGAKADKTSIFGEGPIHFLPFFDEQHIDSISELMVRNGADVNEWAAENPRRGEHGFWGHSPLDYAVVRNNTTSIRALIRLGADPHAKREEGTSAIRWACLLNRAEALDTMIAASGSRLSAEDSASEPLAETVLSPENRLESIKEHGGDHENAKIATLKVLHKYKAVNYRDMNGRGGYTVLHFAAQAGYPKVVNYLLADTPSKQHLDVFYEYKTPLMDVINMGYRDVFEVLLRHGADIHLTLTATWQHASYLHVCAIAGHRDVFFPEQLLKHGAPVDRADEVGRTAFCTAVVDGNYPVADLLLQHGADRDYVHKGYTILARCLEIPLPLGGIEYLMTCKPNPERPPPSFICTPGLGRNVFHAIASAGMDAERAASATRSIFQYLRELWPGEEHINACDRMGAPPLAIAVARPKEDFINMMIRAGANPNLGPLPPLYIALLRQNWANEQTRKVGGRWMTRRIKRIADNVVVILKGGGARADIDPHTGIPRAFDIAKLFGGMTAEDIEVGLRMVLTGLRDSEAGVTERYGQRAVGRKSWECFVSSLSEINRTGQGLPLRFGGLASQSNTAEPRGRNQQQNTTSGTQENTQLNRRERDERSKGQLGEVSGMVMDGINGTQVPGVGSEASWPRGSEMPVNPGRGISQLPLWSSDSSPPTCRPPSREPETSTNTWSIPQLSPSSDSSSAPTYRPPPEKPGSSRGAQRGILRSFPSDATSTVLYYRPQPRRPASSPARRSPPPSLLDTPVPSSLSLSSRDILQPTQKGISQLSQSITSSAPGIYRPPPPHPVPAPQRPLGGAPSSRLEPRTMTMPAVTRETQLALALSSPQASPPSLQSPSSRQGITQLLPSPQPAQRARHWSSSSPFPQHIPWTIPHQRPPYEILDSLRPAVLPFITALVDSRQSDAIPRRNLKICLESHLCVPNLIDLKWDPVAPLGSSSVKELQSGVNRMLRGFSIIINLKLRVEMGGECGTRTMLRVLMDEDGGSTGSGDGWLRTEGAGWENLERIEVGIMFPQEA
ncbi:hypothetical protein HOY80DRAFT_956446 [Tuber brumale]|nr:hypothetical protein HOY80DRAFT_956446 [Tuber brumale]